MSVQLVELGDLVNSAYLAEGVCQGLTTGFMASVCFRLKPQVSESSIVPIVLASKTDFVGAGWYLQAELNLNNNTADLVLTVFTATTTGEARYTIQSPINRLIHLSAIVFSGEGTLMSLVVNGNVVVNGATEVEDFIPDAADPFILGDVFNQDNTIEYLGFGFINDVVTSFPGGPDEVNATAIAAGEAAVQTEAMYLATTYAALSEQGVATVLDYDNAWDSRSLVGAPFGLDTSGRPLGGATWAPRAGTTALELPDLSFSGGKLTTLQNPLWLEPIEGTPIIP